MRWSEEVLLLKEEMARVSLFFRWKADWWNKLGSQDALNLKHDDLPTEEGRKSYAQRQSLMYTSMEARCESVWSVVPSLLASSQLYRADYTPGASASAEASVYVGISGANM
jgi:hypothetical protein